MNRILLAAATTVLLATSAGAGQITFSLPNLTFPPHDGATVTKSCLESGAMAGLCAPQG